MNASDVAGAVAGHDLVVVSLGNSQNPFALMLDARRTTPSSICELGTSHIVTAMREAGIARLLVVTAFWHRRYAGALAAGLQAVLPHGIARAYGRRERQEAVANAFALDWIIVQPAGLTDGVGTNTWLADTYGAIRKQLISRADVAACIVSLIKSMEYSGTIVAVSG
jgi:hypothetical protein